MAVEAHTNPVVERVPYHQNFDLQQLFDNCSGCVVAIGECLQLKRPVLYRRLDIIHDTLQSLSSDFCSASDLHDNSAYLLIVVLQKIYEVLRHGLDSVGADSQPSTTGASSSSTILGHGELHILIEKLVDSLDVSEDEVDRIEEYVFQVQRYIHRMTRHMSPLERLVSQAEGWIDQLIALSLYAFCRHTLRSSDSVVLAQEKIKTLLDMRERQ